jgi:dipeptidyl aminopeptidase/acylaminoacyl peptidase
MTRVTLALIFVSVLAMTAPIQSNAHAVPEAGVQPLARFDLPAPAAVKPVDGNAQDARSFQNGRVVGSERVDGEGSSQIFSFASDGSDRKQLTSSGSNIIPSWSRDGKRILYSCNYEIWVMNADGSGKRQLTINTQGGNFAPVESPDGKKIAFAGVRSSGQPEVWVMNADGSDPRRLTSTPPIPPTVRTNTAAPTYFDTLPPKMRAMEKQLPPWLQNPDNQEKSAEATALLQKVQGLVKANEFAEAEKNVDSILKMIGVSPEAVVQNAPRLADLRWSSHPTWSADGKRIAYSSSRSGSAQIWVMNADGSEQTQLTHGLGGRFPDANVPCWSLDGKLITFWAGHESRYGDIWVMEPDGKNPRRITQTKVPANSDDPHWSPDRTKVIYGSGQPGERAMFVVDVKTGTVTPFARNIQWCDWQPILR